MALFSFGKRNKPREFGFVPRYYDKDKEDLQARLARYDREADNAELMKARIKSGFKYNSRGDHNTYRTASRKSNVRLLLIIGTLVLVSLYILQSDSMLNFMESFISTSTE